jgi:hypothetical protein
MSVKQPSPKTLLFDMCAKWIEKMEITCPEVVYQCDRVSEEATTFIEQVCKIVGYYEPEDGDDK